MYAVKKQIIIIFIIACLGLSFIGCCVFKAHLFGGHILSSLHNYDMPLILQRQYNEIENYSTPLRSQERRDPVHAYFMACTIMCAVLRFRLEYF
jgi:hypothetical protein